MVTAMKLLLLALACIGAAVSPATGAAVDLHAIGARGGSVDASTGSSPVCTVVPFDAPFPDGDKVFVFVTILDDNPIPTSSARSQFYANVHSITTTQFTACVHAHLERTTTIKSGLKISYLAISEQLALANAPSDSMMVFEHAHPATYTGRRECAAGRPYPTGTWGSFSGRPLAFTTVRTLGSTARGDGIYSWLEDINAGDADYCLQAADTVIVPQQVYTQVLLLRQEPTLGGSSSDIVTVDSQCGSGTGLCYSTGPKCQTTNYGKTLDNAPSIFLATVNHRLDEDHPANGASTVTNSHAAQMVWAETLPGTSSARYCVAEPSWTSGHDKMVYHLLAIGELDPFPGAPAATLSATGDRGGGLVTTAPPVVVEVEFSEPVFGLTAGSFSLSGGAASVGALSGADGGSSYTLEVVPGATGGAPIVVQLPAAAVTDLIGTANTASGALSIQFGGFATSDRPSLSRRRYTSAELSYTLPELAAGDSWASAAVELRLNATDALVASLPVGGDNETSGTVDFRNLDTATAFYAVTVATASSAGALAMQSAQSSAFRTGDPFGTRSAGRAAREVRRRALEDPSSPIRQRRPTLDRASLGDVRDAPFLLCANGQWRRKSAGCAGDGGEPSGGAPELEGSTGSLRFLDDYDTVYVGNEAAYEAAFCQDVADTAGVDVSRCRVESVDEGSIVVEYSLLPELDALGCTPLEDGEIPPPVTLHPGSTGVFGDRLRLVFDSSMQYTSTEFAFEGAEAVAGCYGGATADWTVADSGDSVCAATHTGEIDLTFALASCGFEDRGSGVYGARVRMTTVRPANPSVSYVDGDLTRTDSTVVNVEVSLPLSANVTAGPAGVFGGAIDFSAATRQVVNMSTPTAPTTTVTLVTSVQWPYRLGAPSVSGDDADFVVVGGAGAAVSAEEADCEADTGAGCTERWAVVVEPTSPCPAVSALSGTYTAVFPVTCAAAFASGSCDLPSPATVTVVFTLNSDDYCPRVVEVGSVTPQLRMYASADARENNPDTAAGTDAVLSTRVFFRADVDVEAGVQLLQTTLEEVLIRSQCSGCSSPDVYAIASSMPGLEYNPTEATAALASGRHDFSFVLNSSSISFDDDQQSGASQVDVVVEATIGLVYAEPLAQGADGAGPSAVRRVRALTSTAAITQPRMKVSVSTGAGSAGGGASSAGSGGGALSGTVAVGAAAFVAAIAVLGVVAVARRRKSNSRRGGGAAAQQKVAHTSSSLELFPAVAAVEVEVAHEGLAEEQPEGPAPGSTLSLGDVSAAYEAVHA